MFNENLFYKISNSQINLNRSVEEGILLKMNKLLTNKLEGKKYSNEISKNCSLEIINELNNYLVEKKISPRPASCNICSILKKPCNFIFNYKVIKLNHIPLMVSYSNDSLYSQLILIILNN